MARHLLVFLGRAYQHTAAVAAAAPPLIVLLVVVVVTAVVVSLCTSSTHAKLWNKHRGTSTSAPAPRAPPPKLQEAGVAASRKHLLASLSGIGGRAASMAKMVSWNRQSPAQVGSGDDEEAAGLTVVDEEALWRKDILMGVKCRPLEFSGRITFDCDGNQLLSPPPPAPVPHKKAAADIAEISQIIPQAGHIDVGVCEV